MAKNKVIHTIEIRNGFTLENVVEDIDTVDGKTTTVSSYRVVTSTMPMAIIKDQFRTENEARKTFDEMTAKQPE